MSYIDFFKQAAIKIKERIQGSKIRRSDSPKPLVQANHNLTPSFIMDLARRYEGKLLLQEEITLPTDIFLDLVSHHYFISFPSISKNIFYNKCNRCHNKHSSYFAEIPCLKCNKIHLYCRKCILMGRVLACTPLYAWNGPKYTWPKHQNAYSWTGNLTEGQERAANKIMDVIFHRGRLIVWAVTGAGKTEMLFPGISKALEAGLRICIASPRADVVRELQPRLATAFQAIHIQGLYSGSRDSDGTAQLMIATTHQLLRYQDAFDVLIIDEIDAFPYHQDSSLQFAAERARKKSAAVIYLTATPRDKQHFQMAMKQMEHIFVPLRFHGQAIIMPQWIQVHQLKKHLRENTFPKAFMDWLKKRMHSQRQLLIFIPTIQLASELEEPLGKVLLHEKLIAGMNEITSVHAEDKDRKEKIIAFRNKEFYALLTTTILERGVTFPSIDVVVLGADHQVFDEAALIQIAGRAGRSPIDPNGEVIFFHDGKTDAMVRANRSISEMNKLGKEMRMKQENIS